MSSLKVIGWSSSHTALIAALDRESPRSVLDVPCGTGRLATYLQRNGWQVHCADVDPGNFQLHDKIPFTQVDLNRPLPFDDASFDVVVCANGLHRLFNPRGAVQEFARILKPNGSLYINVNNYTSIFRRVTFLITGSVSKIFDDEYFQQTIQNPEANIRFPIVCSQIAAYLRTANLTLVGLSPASIRWKERLFWPLGLIVALCAYCTSLVARYPAPIRINNSRAVLFGGGYLLIKATKPPEKDNRQLNNTQTDDLTLAK